MKILIVDDNKENLYLLEVLLQGNGYEVVSAANGAEALEKLRAEHFDMIITDILMPVMDGFQLCRKVKGDAELKDIPFVFYTATYVDEEDEQFALELGAEKFIRKPTEPDEFMKIARGVFGDAEAGRMAQPKPVLVEEGEVFRLYSERLVNKLEKKMLDLEREITERQQAEEELKKHRDHLEDLVEERTAELTRANEQLEQEIAEHKRAEEALRETSDYLDSLIRYANAPIIVWDPSLRITRFNHAFEYLTGYTADEVIGQELRVLFPEASRDEALSKIARALSGEHWKSVEIPILRQDGDIRLALWNSANIYAEDGKTLLATIAQGQDITERKRAEDRLEHLNLVLRAIRFVNQLIVRERDRGRLLQSACDSLIETRGYYNAWIALLDEAGGLVTITEAGLGEDFLLLIEQLKHGELPTCGRAALSQSGVVAIEDRVSACADCPLSKNYGDRGTMTVRLEYGGKVYGLLTVSLPGDLVADGEEQALLREVADDISFALHSIELEEEHKRAEKELRNAYKQLQDIIEFLPDATFVINMDKKVIAWNQAMEEMTGVHKDEIMGKGDYAYAVPFYGIRRPIFIDVVLSSDEEIKSLYDHVERKGNALIAEVFLPLMYEGRGGYFWGTATLLLNGEGNIAGAIESIRDVTERKQAEEELQYTLEKLREALGGIIQTIALTVETKDPYTAGHQRRAANLTCAIANEMGLPEDQIDGIRMAGLIHDLGKIAIPTEILNKLGSLNDIQYCLVQTHSQVGHDILKEIEFPWPVAQIVLQHHERLDGSGYPQGLSGEEIILEARILAVADVVEAMASFRPYRPALGVDKALEEISHNRGVLYDPEVVDACLKLFTEERFTFE